MTNITKENIRILLVDDDSFTRNMISVLLSQLGYDNILIAQNGMEALKKLKLTRCDLVLSDWKMPEMDGLTLWRSIRDDDALKSIPFILVTAMDEVDMVKKAISEGITDYLVKPITIKALTDKIEKALKK